MATKTVVDNGWINRLLEIKVANWNDHAKVVMCGLRDLEHHGLFAVWIKSELQEMLALYNSIVTLIEAGADISTVSSSYRRKEINND